MDGQSKNIIKSVTTLFLLVVFGEGVMGWGLFWPFLLIMIGYKGVYWLAFGVGILVSVFHGLLVGLPSLFILVVVGLLSFFLNVKKEIGWVVVVLGVLCGLVFDLVFGLSFGIVEAVMIVIAGVFAVFIFENSDSISLKY